MYLRPVTDSHEDYFSIRQMYNEWKQCDFTLDQYISYIRALPNSVLFVATDNKQIFGSCKVILEPKLAFGTWVCHIEDVVVKKQFRCQGIGTKIIKYVVELCKENQWDDNIRIYKLRLGCKDSLENFYEQCGLTRTGSEMVCYFKNSFKTNVM